MQPCNPLLVALRWCSQCLLPCLACFLLLPVLASSCVRANQQDQERSLREVRLAASLREEGSLAGALSHVKLALKLDPENARAHLLYGYVQLERLELSKAREHVERAIELLQDVAPERSTLAEAKNLLGVVLIEERRYPQALKLLRKTAKDPYNVAPHFSYGNLGLVYARSGMRRRALRALRKSVAIEPKFCLGYYRIGEIHFEKGAFREAEEAFTDALEADERCKQFYQDAWALRGETRARLGLRDDAVADFERCVELGKNTRRGRSCRRFLDATMR